MGYETKEFQGFYVNVKTKPYEIIVSVVHSSPRHALKQDIYINFLNSWMYVYHCGDLNAKHAH